MILALAAGSGGPPLPVFSIISFNHGTKPANGQIAGQGALIPRPKRDRKGSGEAPVSFGCGTANPDIAGQDLPVELPLFLR
jgi:hypothetical protein